MNISQNMEYIFFNNLTMINKEGEFFLGLWDSTNTSLYFTKHEKFDRIRLIFFLIILYDICFFGLRNLPGQEISYILKHSRKW